MKVNKPKSTFLSGTDAPDEKDIKKALKGEKFADALSALDSAASSEAATGPTHTALSAIAAQYDLLNEENKEDALRESSEFLVKSRLNEKYQKSEKVIKDLGEYITNDPFLKNKMLSILQRLRDQQV